MSGIQEMRIQSLGWEDPLVKEVATHSNILAWEIPWTEEPVVVAVVVESVSHVWLFVTPWTHARLPCTSLSLAQTHVHWVGNAIQTAHRLSPLLLLFSIFPSIRLFSSELALCIRGSKYWSFSFSISPSNEYSRLVCYPCCPRDFQESSPASQFESIDSSAPKLLYGPTLTSIHDYWKNHSFEYMDLCQQSNVSAF